MKNDSDTTATSGRVYCLWALLLCLECTFSACLTGLLWMATQQPWVAVFACGIGLAVCLQENRRLSAESRDKSWHVHELEKQVVSLRTLVDTLSRDNALMDVEFKRLKFKRSLHQPRRSLSGSDVFAQ